MKMPSMIRSLMLLSILALVIGMILGCGLANSSTREPAEAAVAGATRPGEPAPDFSLPTATGSTVSLKDYAGKSKVALIFYRGFW